MKDANPETVACWLYRNINGALINMSQIPNDQWFAKLAAKGIAEHFCEDFDGGFVMKEREANDA